MNEEKPSDLLTRLRYRNDQLTAENYCLRNFMPSKSKTQALWLIAVFSVCILALTTCSCALILAARHTLLILPDKIDAAQAALIAQVQDLQLKSLAELDKHATGIRHDATTQLSGIRRDALAGIDGLRATADRQLTGTRDDVKEIGKILNSQVDAVKFALIPVLTNTAALTANAAALTKDAQDSLDDIYPDARALVESATVATTQTAQTMETVRAAAPAFTADVSGAVADFHDATHNLDVRYFHPPPMNRKQKVAAFFSNFEALAIAALRGGVL